MPPPRALILRAPGTNCDEETAAAWRLAGADVETWHVGRALESPESLDRYQILTIPGGFSYGDDLGAGKIFAARLISALGDTLRRFHDRGGLLLGVCNGFQVLVKSGLLPGGPARRPATITRNDSGHFEDRWVRLAPAPGRSPFLADAEPIELPVAHGEGKFLADPADLAALDAAGQLVLRYAGPDGLPTQSYPANPNGSPLAVAGLCDPTGRIFGLMPHPERHADPLQHPRWTRLGPKPEGDGLRIFRNAVAALR
jgi:phosphoribosylformylglycinamidine synthase subunit PurQ / glutaminase